MANTTFGDLTVVTNTALPSDQQWFTVACSGNAVNLMFGEHKTLRISSIGVWTHSVLFWRGELNKAFQLLIDAIPSNTVIYRNAEVLVLYLKNNFDYGCLQVSVRLHKNHEMTIRNLTPDPLLKKLDELYDVYVMHQDVNACLNHWVSAPLNTDLMGSSFDTKQIRERIHTTFTKEFIEDPEGAGAEIEHAMSHALNVPRVYKIKYIIARMFKYACELPNP